MVFFSVTTSDTSARNYVRSQSLPEVQLSVQHVLEMLSALSDQSAFTQWTVEPSLQETRANTGTHSLFDIENHSPFNSVMLSFRVHV